MTHQEIIEACINKELKPYNITYNDVKRGGIYEYMQVGIVNKKRYFFGLFKKDEWSHIKKPWYQFFTFNTKEEYESWKEFCINLFRKELKLSKKAAERLFPWFDLNYGLKQNYELDK